MKFIAASSIAVWATQVLHVSASSTRSPVEKVVGLLQDLKAKLEGDQSAEQQVYDRYACWCEETTARKATAIEDAHTSLRSLGQEILVQKGTVELKTIEIEETTREIKANEEEQEQATAIRQKENEAYMVESAEMKQAIVALEKALLVLRDATSGFLQVGSGVDASAKMGRVLATLEDAVSLAPTRALAHLAKNGGSSKLALLKAYAKELTHQAGKARYTPQSATIQGILKDMYETFASDIQGMDSTEAGQNRNFETLIATKQEELLLLQKKVADAEKAKAEAELMLAEATQSYDDTEEQLAADIEFFDATKSACTSKSDEWKERKTLREQELAAVAQAVQILSSDEARTLFNKAIKPGVQSFLQVASVEDMAAIPTKKAYKVLKGMATKSKSLRLARLAATVFSAKVGHFDTVISAIDTMIADLKQEFADDIAKRDQCKDEYQSIESKSKDLEWKVEVNTATITKLEEKILKLKEEKAETIKTINDTQVIIVDLNDTRQSENAAFLESKADDQDAINLLEEAMTLLADFYKNNTIELGPVQGIGLLQSEPEFERSADAAPDAEFSDKGKRKGQSKGVIALIMHIIDGLHGEISAAIKAEESAQLEYETQLKAAQDLILKLEIKRTNLETTISEREVKKGEEEQDKTQNEGDLKSEQDYKKEIEPDCDYIIDKFAERTEKRTAEIDGLTQAKDYLAGYQESAAAVADAALLQSRGAGEPAPRSFDDNAFGQISWHGFD